MRLERREPARTFEAGRNCQITISHVADLELEPDEQVTLVGPQGSELDIVRKDWGYYGTPSLNGRLRRKGLRAALAHNEAGLAYLMLVEEGRERAFHEYCRKERQTLICWLDSDEAVAEAVARLDRSRGVDGPGPT